MFKLIGFLIIGLIAGWLAGKIMQGRSLGLGMNLLVGVIGSILGGFIFGLLGLSAHGLIGGVVMATVGAVAFLFIASALKKT